MSLLEVVLVLVSQVYEVAHVHLLFFEHVRYECMNVCTCVFLCAAYVLLERWSAWRRCSELLSSDWQYYGSVYVITKEYVTWKLRSVG